MILLAGLFLLSLILTYFVRKFALQKSLLDMPNHRSSHSVPTPHGGGVAIALTWFGGLIYLRFMHQIEPQLFLALMMGILISVVSYIDDLFDLSSKVRLVAQSLTAVGALIFLGGFERINFEFFTLHSAVLGDIFAFLLIVWFINLYNFLDGIDGYAGSEAIFLALAGFAFFGGEHFLVLAVSVFGFLVWNWQKAKIFMGDVGSTLLGFNIAVFTLYYAKIESSNLWIWITLFGIFWFDATLTLFRRYKNADKLSVAHRKHGYQRLVQSGWSHQKVVLASMLVNALLFALVYFIWDKMLAFVVSLIMLYGVMKFIDRKKGF